MPSCTDCSLGLNEKLRTPCVPSLAEALDAVDQPLGTPDITFVVEEPGRMGDRNGAAMAVISADDLSDTMDPSVAFWSALEASGYTGPVNIVALNRCHSKEITEEQVVACLPRLWEELRTHRPRVVVTCGKTVTKYLTNTGTLKAARGRFSDLNLKKGLGEVPEDLRDLIVTSTSSPNAIWAQDRLGKGQGRHQFLQDIAHINEYLHGAEIREGIDYKWLDDLTEVEEYFTEIINDYGAGKIPGVVVDIESNMHLNPFKSTAQLVSIGFCAKTDKARGVLVTHYDENLENDSMFRNDDPERPFIFNRFCQLLQWLFDHVPAGGWNVKFDVRWIRRFTGAHVRKIFFDGLVTHTAVFSELKPHDLKSATTDMLGKVISELPLNVAIDQLKKRYPNHPDRWHHGHVPRGILRNYMLDDVNYTWQMYSAMQPWVENDHHQISPALQRKHPGMNHTASIEHHQLPPILVFSEVEDNGVKVDRKMLALYQREYPKRLAKMQEALLRNPWVDAVWQEMKAEAEAEAWDKLQRKIERHNQRELAKAEKLKDKGYEPNLKRPDPADMSPKYKDQHTVLSYYFNLSKVLYEKAGVPYEQLKIERKSIKGKGSERKFYCSTDAFALGKVLEWAQTTPGQEPLATFLKDLSKYKKTKKMHEGYVEPMESLLDENDILRTTYNLGGARTGRASTSDPNLHGMPTRSEGDALAITKLFISRWKAEGGLIFQADYSQLEMRIVAAIADEPNLKAIFESGIDTHRAMAAKIFRKDPDDITKEERSQGKTIAFGVLYGMAYQSLAARTGLPPNDAKRLIDQFFEAYPSLYSWVQNQVALMKSRCVVKEGTGREIPNPRYNPMLPTDRFRNPKFITVDYSMDLHGYVETVPPFSRKRILKNGGHWEYSKASKAERQAFNTPIQSIASDITLAAACRVHWGIRERELRTLLFGFIHDSLKTDTYPGEFLDIVDLMETEMKHRLPYLYGEWLTSPIDISMEVGVGWGYHCEVSRLDGGYNEFEIEGDVPNVDSTLAALGQAFFVDNLTHHMVKENSKTAQIRLRKK